MPTIPGIAEGIDGSSGYDRVEVDYDENSNVTAVTEQRGVAFANAYDLGNRLTEQNITLVTGVLGEKKRTFEYDELNRIVEAKNDFARVARFYDPLSRLTDEVQRIRLDGKGHTNGWKHPITIHSEYDKQSNRGIMDVLEGPKSAPTNTDMNTVHTYDALNRKDTISASYFGEMMSQKVQYNFNGPWRVESKVFGNGATDSRLYDAKRRVRECASRDAMSNMLVGFQYGTSQLGEANFGYDRVDNPLHEGWLHDGGMGTPNFDNYNYNERYELTGTQYRAASSTDYRSMPGGYTDMFVYDDNFNRESASFADPFNNETVVDTNYQISSANEYTSFDRSVNGGAVSTLNPAHDRAGNMTTIPLMPGKGVNAGQDVDGVAKYDAFNRIFKLKAGAIREQEYRYDAFGRRIVRMELANTIQVVDGPITAPLSGGGGGSPAPSGGSGAPHGEAAQLSPPPQRARGRQPTNGHG